MSAVIGALRAVLSLESAAFSAGLKDARKRLTGFEKDMQRHGANMAKVGAVISALGAGIAASLRGSLNAADEMGQMAQKWGVPVEELSRLSYAAGLSDVSLDTLGASLKRMSLEMAAGGKSFEAVGVAIRDSTGQMRPTQDVLADVSDVFAKMPDGAEKTALAIRMFGKSGADMIPLLNGGGQAMRDYAAEADRLGITISQETSVAANQFNDNLDRLWGTMKGISNQIAAELAPMMAKLSEVAVSAAQGFADLSPEVRNFAAWAAVITIALGPALLALGTVVAALGRIRLALSALGALFSPIFVGMAMLASWAWIVWQQWDVVKESYVQMWGDMTAAAEAASLAVSAAWNGTVDFFTKLGTDIAAAFVDSWEMVKKDAQSAVANVVNVWTDIKALLALQLLGIKTAFEERWESVKAIAAGWVNDFLLIGQNIVDGLKAGIDKKWKEFTGYFTGLGTDLVDVWNAIWEVASPSKVTERLGNNITEGLAIGLEGGIAGVNDAMATVNAAVAGPANSLASAFEAVESWGGSALASLIKGTQSLSEVLTDLANQMVDIFANAAWNSLWGGLFGTEDAAGLFSGEFAKGGVFNAGQVTAFANGGVVRQATMFPMKNGMGMMGEAGPEAIMPLTRDSGGRLGVKALVGARGGQNVQIVQNFQTGVAQTVRAEMMALLPQMMDAMRAGMVDGNQRGGSFAAGMA